MDFTEKTIDTKEIYSGRIIHIKEDIVRLPNGETAGRELVLHNGGVAVIAVDENKDVFMVRQYRKPYEEVVLEVPAGKLENGENPQEAGLRELREETGYIAKKSRFIGKCYPSPGYLNEVISMYLAEDLEFVGQELDPGEFVEVEKIPLQRLFEMVMDNKIADAKTQIAILKAYEILSKE
ncbi:MAG: NUDIX hydrolase [Clostridia bacterium]|nr:NUDIX hydrolase [Clostridia bacterium]